MERDNILATIKKMLGGDQQSEAFDTDIIVHMNSAFMALQQIGVGPDTTFYITSGDEVWVDFLNDVTNLEAVKTYIYLKVRLVFDTPSSSFVIGALEKNLAEIEWRLMTQAEENRSLATV